MTRRILRQKLALPAAWEGAVARPRLEAMLDDALAGGAHVGVFAGTGYGKTAVLAAWAARQPRVAWLTLDAEDADLDQFLAYLLAAIARALPGFRSEAESMLGRARERDGAFAALSALLADLDEQCDAPLAIVLDDYHLAASPSLDALAARLIRYLPGAVRLVVASRRPPEIELAMLQAQRLLRLVDEPLLAFGRDELRSLRPGATEVALDELLGATGGWPAAMGLAPELLDAYLDEQLLSRLEPALVAFLQRLAVVEVFDAGLCEEALGEPLARDRRERLLAERLISPRGRDRYALHPALRGLLARRFQADVARDERRALLRRVGDYHWRMGVHSTALRFWSDAGETAWAADRLAEVAEAWLAAGRLDALASALGALGAEGERPALLALQGELCRRWGELARAERCFEQAVGGGPALSARARLGLAQVAAARGEVAKARGHLDALAPADLAGSARVDVEILEGGLALLEGGTERAIAMFEEARAHGAGLGDAYAEARATHNLGICYIRAGEFARALACYDGAIAMAAADGTPLVWMAPINRALVLIHLGQPAEAAAAAEAALAMARRFKLTREEGYALRILGFAHLRGGAPDRAASGFEAAERLARRSGDALGLAYSLNFRAELALARGELAAASALVAEAEGALGGPDAAAGILEFAQIRAKIAVEAGDAAGARALIDALMAKARSLGYAHALHEVEELATRLAPRAQERRVPAARPPAAAPAPALRIRCFGGLRVSRPDGEVTDKEWQTARAKQLLAYFLHAADGATKAHLLEAVFPGEEVSNDLMNMTLMRLRKALEPRLDKGQASRFILRADGRYAFNRQAPVELDTADFEAALREARPGAEDEPGRLERAIALYRGDFLPEVPAPWAVALRNRFQEQALTACRRLLALLDQAPSDAVHGLLRRALEIDPVNEEFNRELILRYLEADDRRLAVQHFRLCERRFREILDAPPPADLASLVAGPPTGV